MMRLQMMICLAMLAACAGPKSESKLEQQVTRIDGAKTGAVETATAPSKPAPQVDADAPGPDWMMRREDRTFPDAPPATVMLINSAPNVQATVMVSLKPSVGTPKEMAEFQRESLLKSGVTCSPVVVSKDGDQAWFTTKLKLDSGKIRKGKTVYLLRQNRKEYTVALYAAWNSLSDKPMLAAIDKIASSVTVK